MGFVHVEDRYFFEESGIPCILRETSDMTAGCVKLLGGDEYMAVNTII
jgi:hypothetical protein